MNELYVVDKNHHHRVMLRCPKALVLKIDEYRSDMSRNQWIIDTLARVIEALEEIKEEELTYTPATAVKLNEKDNAK